MIKAIETTLPDESIGKCGFLQLPPEGCMKMNAIIDMSRYAIELPNE